MDDWRLAINGTRIKNGTRTNSARIRHDADFADLRG